MRIMLHLKRHEIGVFITAGMKCTHEMTDAIVLNRVFGGATLYTAAVILFEP